jgi:hypothetical protein
MTRRSSNTARAALELIDRRTRLGAQNLAPAAVQMVLPISSVGRFFARRAKKRPTNRR